MRWAIKAETFKWYYIWYLSKVNDFDYCMRHFKILSILVWALHSVLPAIAQHAPEGIYKDNIKTVRLHVYGDQQAMPVYKLNSTDRMELHFDDLDANVKNYYYTYQLCDYNWQPVNLSPFDYIKGFTQQRLATYRYSSIAFTRYTHYQAILPETNCIPSRSGNYLLKVFLDGDTSKLVFTRALLVLDAKTAISAQLVQPFTPQYFKTHQRLKFAVNTQGFNMVNPAQQVKVKVLQNQRWDNAQGNLPPTFIRGTTLEYNNENNFVFAAGKEWRWLDLRSLRLLSDRIERADNKKNTVDIFVKPDIDLNTQRYMYYADLNGNYQVVTYETINPYWQGDYATVHFSFLPVTQAPYEGKELYLIGQLTDYRLTDKTRLQFNESRGMYECSLFLKQGYYSYGYTLVDAGNMQQRTDLEGNYWETENSYTILVYYRGFSDQYDQLIGISHVNSRTDKPGFSF